MTDIAASAGLATMAPEMKAVTTEIPGRLFEWVAATMMIGIAIILTIWPQSIDDIVYRELIRPLRGIVDDQIVESILRFCFFAGGMLRYFALYANGRLPVIGPRLRGAGAGAAALLWSQMFVAGSMEIIKTGHGTVEVVLLGCMACGEIISCYRSGAHGRWKR